MEKLAGKGMQQLESDREQRDIMEAKQKAAYIASLPCVFSPMLHRLAVSSCWKR